MQLNFKTYLPWILVIILLGIMIWPKEKKSLPNNESTIESRLYVEESLVDSFSDRRDFIREELDSSLSRIDTLDPQDLLVILHNNMLWYENKTSCPPIFSRDTIRVDPREK